MQNNTSAYIWKNYRIKLHNLTDEQKARILKVSYARRFLYNWALEICNKSYNETGRIPNYQEISRMFTKYKKLPGNEWLDELNVTACRYAFKDLSDAFHNFFLGICKHPIFKERKTDSVRFAVNADCLTFKGEDGRYAFIPVLSARKGDLIDCGNHKIPHFKGIKYSNTRIKFDGNNYWLSLSVKTPVNQLQKPIIYENSIIGIDVGVRTAATLSTGESFDRVNQKRLSVLENRREKLQSSVDRDLRRRMNLSESTRTKYEDIPKSKNQLKREFKLAKTRIQIHNLHNTYYHQISRQIANYGYDVIVLESLNVHKSIVGAHGLAKRDIYESRMATLANYIEYKCIDTGSIVIRADREYPSSQICSRCGHIHKIGPNKIYRCKMCGFEIDRDLNAAINLKDFGISRIRECLCF